MKHTNKKILSGFIAMSMALPIAAPAELLSVSDILIVNAADQVKTGKTADGYDYELWNQNGQGQASMDLGTNGGFSCSWNNIENALFRTGKKLGSTKKYQDYGNIAINYDVDYQPMGNSYMCVYGWTEDPTVEYYIVEAWGDWRPPGATNGKAVISSDGKTYDVYTSTRYNQPSIHGTETFEQYWSVNKTNPAQVNAMKNLKGTITVSDHFAAWERSGMKMGKMYEVALNIEGYRSSGKAIVNKNELIIGGDNPNASTGTTGGSSSSEKAPEGTAPSAGTGIATDCESNAGGWTNRGDGVKLVLTGDQKHDGSKSLAVTGRTNSWNGIQNSSSELKAGGTYTIESYVTYTNEEYSSAGFTVGLQYDDASGKTNYDDIANATTSAGKWVKLGDKFTVPSGATNISVYIQTKYAEVDSASDLINFYVDDISITGGSSSSATTTPTKKPDSSETVSADSLKGKFANCFKMGTSVSPNELSTGADFIKKHFNSITPENELKPDALLSPGTDNTRAKVSLNRAAATLKFCEDNGISLRGHTFVWYSQTPGWFFKENFDNNGAYVSKDIMNKRLENFIKDTFEAIATQYPNLDLYAYDVCNELFLNDGGGLRKTTYTQNSGASDWAKVYGEDNDEFIINAFKYARQYAPKGCKLYINDYNEYIPAKTDDIYNIAMKLKELGYIDGIGMQSHLDISYPSAQVFKTGLEKFLSTGLEVQITELDITCGTDFTSQAKLFADVFQMAVDHADQIPAFTVWGTNDSISWRRENNPLLFSAGYQPKAAYDAVMAVDVSGVTASNPGTTPTTPSTSATQGASSAVQDFKFGDINDDGKVDITDLSLLSVHLVDRNTFTDKQNLCADVEYDGEVNLADLATLKQFISKIITKLGEGYVAPTPAPTPEPTPAATPEPTPTPTPEPTPTATPTPEKKTTGSKGKVVNGMWTSDADTSWIDPSKPMVAISFDDGPIKGSNNPSRIQAALTKNGFHATFFYWGERIAGNEQEILNAYNAGFEVANHSWTHPQLTQQGDKGKSEVQRCKQALDQIIGGDNDYLLRPPYLATDAGVCAAVGVPMPNCGIDTQDWNGASKDQIVNKLKSAMADGSLRNAVVLCHENYDSTASAMEEFLPYLKSQGWQCVTVSEMFAAQGKTMQAGVVYNYVK